MTERTLKTEYPRLLRTWKAGNIIRDAWCEGERGPDGWERACLLTALVPEVGDESDPSACPDAILPVWMADATIEIDDECDEESWQDTIDTYVELLGKSLDFTSTDWDLLYEIWDDMQQSAHRSIAEFLTGWRRLLQERAI